MWSPIPFTGRHTDRRHELRPSTQGPDPTNRGVETISVAPVAKRWPSEHDHIVSSPPSTDVVDSSYRWRPLRHGRGAEADPTAAPGAAAVSDSGELARSRRFSSRNPWDVEQPIGHLALPRPQFSRFRPGAAGVVMNPSMDAATRALPAFGSLDRSRRSGDLPLRPGLHHMLPGCNLS